MSGISVELQGITKRFGQVLALNQVSLSASPGALHAVVGENGAGKTTLMRVLYGAIKPDAGKILLDSQERYFLNSAQATAAHIGMVSQHYSIIPELTCLENLMLGAEPGWSISRRVALERAEALSQKMGFQFQWQCEASTLSPAGKQKLEILKLLWREASVMILDEPTAMLSPADSEALFLSLRKLAEEGATLLLVTHRIPEVLDHCQRVTVLRGGQKVADLEVNQTNAGELAELIVGHALSAPVVHESPKGKPVLELKSLTIKGARGEDAVKGADLTLYEGEVVGLAGVDGNGQAELFQAILGTLDAASGQIQILGANANSLSSADRLIRGLRSIPEDRHEEGVIEDWSLEANATLGLQRLEPLASGVWVVPEARKALAARVAERFSTKHDGLHQPIRSLSGGNQQRFVAARALELSPKLILAFQPTRGLDIDATAQVYQAIRDVCAAGAAALIVSFDLDELLEHCGRVLAINHGCLREPPKGLEKDRQTIGQLMVGAA